ncbi:MAG: LON peptidase substrate-binding domain-containing protein [Hyphomicrobiales bacterium]|nr:LON peptidase substrate-binding domain-containing protein [Hyphomicrobiales bacterium]
MSVTDRYSTLSDLPRHLPVFPLQGCIILPRSTLPLNIFEPRYLEMIDNALAGERLIGIVQPHGKNDDEESPVDRRSPLRTTGCVGRITSFSETEDARLLITLAGIARFDIVQEVSTDKPYRMCEVSYERYASDLIHGYGQDAVDWQKLLSTLKTYLSTRQMSADWDSIERSPAELLVNTLSVISPYGPEEKQALLEASTLKERSEVLMALAQMEMASTDDDSSSTLQ